MSTLLILIGRVVKSLLDMLDILVTVCIAMMNYTNPCWFWPSCTVVNLRQSCLAN